VGISSDMTVSVSREELIAWAAKSAAFHGLELSRISTVLLGQAYSFEIGRVFSTFDLTKPMKVLEGLCFSRTTAEEPQTVEGDQYKHAPLTGLYKTHFTSPRFLVRNLRNFGRSKEGRRHSKHVLARAVQASASDASTFIKYLAHHMVVEPNEIKHSSNSMTGEWLVYHKHEGKNYYLTFAAHRETNDEIHQRVVLACEFDSFPFKL